MWWKPKLGAWYVLHTISATEILCDRADWAYGTRFRFEFLLYANNDKWAKVCERWHPGDEPSRGMCITKPRLIPTVMMPIGKPCSRLYGTMTHEAVHAAMHLYRLRKMSPSKKEEGFALLVDGITRSLYDDFQLVLRRGGASGKSSMT